MVALCGEVFPVTRAAKPGSPVCPDCKRIYATLKRADAHDGLTVAGGRSNSAVSAVVSAFSRSGCPWRIRRAAGLAIGANAARGGPFLSIAALEFCADHDGETEEECEEQERDGCGQRAVG